MAADQTAQMEVLQHNGNSFEGRFCFTVDHAIVGWELIIDFTTGVSNIMWDGTFIHQQSGSGCEKHYEMVNKQYQGKHDAGAQTMKYNYAEVLMKSVMFYEAQRSGKLPANNRICWRGDSGLSDHGAHGEDLTGGWYDAGDNVKFNFPMAWSTTVLCWSLLEFPEAYRAAGQLDYAYDQVRWPLEYLVKCHTAPNELYVQVGNGQQDHTQWTSPELMDDNRPAYKVDASHPGSDVADETAAAMACGYLAFKEKDPTFANTLLTHAKQIYTFAKTHQGFYSKSVPEAANFYTSNNYTDELVWGGLWLHKATGENSYLQDAQASYEKGPAWGFSWDEKLAGNMVLMCDATHGALGKDDVVATMVAWSPGPDGFGPPFTYTPKCLAWRLQWGALRYSANTAFVALLAAKRGLNKSEYNQWAMCQIHYALGDAGRSFVCGFGKNPPTQPHHRGASCPVRPAPCNWEAQQNPGPNPHVLYGALVGGPGNHDDYTDSRMDFTHNEVACDYNAGFQGAVAGLLQLAIDHELPDPTSCGHC
nr:hypothetical protein BaRGS_017722 [Batillaria attramentaria]